MSLVKIQRPQSKPRSQSISPDEPGDSQNHLSPFQVEKFTYMFTAFFDANEDNYLQKFDIDALLERMRVYCNLEKNDERYIKMTDVLYAFYECLTDQVRNEKSANGDGFQSWSEALKPRKISVDNITLNQWLNMWGRLCHGAAGISGFPYWVQLLAHTFFYTIDRDDDGILSDQEIKNFYKEFIGVSANELDKVSKEGMRAMTANHDYELNKENYLFCFANFLLGRGIYGPGKYIFGTFDNREIDEKYKVMYNVGDVHK